MARIFKRYPEAVDKAQEFFNRLHFSLEELKYQYPDEAFPGESPMQTLRRLAYDGARQRYPEGIPERVSARSSMNWR